MTGIVKFNDEVSKSIEFYFSSRESSLRLSLFFVFLLKNRRSSCKYCMYCVFNTI